MSKREIPGSAAASAPVQTPGVTVFGLENLAAIQELNRQGRHVVLAPNHVSPDSAIRRNLALANDFPVLEKVLNAHGIGSKVVFRGDGDMPVGESKIMETLYDAHRRIFSLLGEAVTGGIPLAINAKEPRLAISRNAKSVRRILGSLEETNLAIYPYGNWFDAREQEFDENVREDGFAEMLPSEVQGRAPDAAAAKAAFEKWRVSLKSGFIRIARRTGSPVVPVYVDNTGGKWVISVGKPIEVAQDADIREVAQEYLDRMKALMAEAVSGGTPA